MKKRNIIIVAIILILIIATVVFIYLTEFQENKISKLESEIEFLKEETTPIRFKILSKEENLIHFAIKFYDADNNEIIRKEYRLEGEQLSFDFVEIPIKDKFLAFPYKIFTDKIAPVEGILLYDLYDINGFPQIFFSEENKENFNNGIKYIFELLKSENTQEIDGIFGNMVQDVKKYNEFKEREIYKIIIHSKGGIEILPD